MTSHSPGSQPILVSGGGIGGLTTALALAQRGHASELFEQADKFAEVGAGLQVGPNAFRIFEKLGLSSQIEKLATFPEALLVKDAATATEIVRLPVGANFRRRFGFPYGLMHRADLHKVLLQACEKSPLIQLNTASKITSFEDEGSAVSVRLSDGSERRGAALVGADGLWSLVRSVIVGDGQPRTAGHICYRAIVPFDDVPEGLRENSMAVWLGPKMHMVLWPMRGDRYYNVSVVFHSDKFDEGWDSFGDPGELRERISNAHPQVRAFVESIQDWRMYVLRDREPTRTWSKGRATLVGDAAHPMLQYLAQGACMAMEDAVCLADEVSCCDGDYAKAFGRYQDRRYLRTTRVQLTARLYGHVYHASDASADLRNQFLRSKSPEETLEGMAWIFDSE
ncbi:MAG: 3-hydroxybenzoate 6-monooxygenase [Pseudomonadota bacterium]